MNESDRTRGGGEGGREGGNLGQIKISDSLGYPCLRHSRDSLKTSCVYAMYKVVSLNVFIGGNSVQKSPLPLRINLTSEGLVGGV